MVVRVPVSQLVLPVGVTGLTVNGKTPTPEPGNTVRTARPGRLTGRQENTHKVTFGLVRANSSKSHTEDGISAVSMHMDLDVSLGPSRQPDNQASKEQLQQGEP